MTKHIGNQPKSTLISLLLYNTSTFIIRYLKRTRKMVKGRERKKERFFSVPRRLKYFHKTIHLPKCARASNSIHFGRRFDCFSYPWEIFHYRQKSLCMTQITNKQLHRRLKSPSKILKRNCNWVYLIYFEKCKKKTKSLHFNIKQRLSNFQCITDEF